MSDETNWNNNLESDQNIQEGADQQENNSEVEQKIPPKYGHYNINNTWNQENQNYQQFNNNTRKPVHVRKSVNESHKTSFAGKVGVTIALGLIFGLVAGVVFQGVNYVSDEYLGLMKKNTVSIETTESLTNDNAASNYANLIAESGTVAGVAQACMPSVVAITSVSVQEIQSFFGTHQYQSAGSGSGIIVGENDEELLIATNNHVVDRATTLSVCFIGNDVVNAEEETQSFLTDDGDLNLEDAVAAKIKGTDPENDLAVISVKKSDIPDDTMSEIKIAQLGDSDGLVVGEQVVAIGNALGYGQSVTSGWVSALNRNISFEDGYASDLIQTDAAINPGNSGGALLNMSGELIGINSAKYADSAVEGMGYAIPISKAKPILDDLMSRVTREKVDSDKSAYLGVVVADLTSEAIQMYNMPAGAFVIDVEGGEAAETAGIKKGDIITKLDGQKVSGRDDLIEKLQYYEAGEEIELIIARADNGEYVEQTIAVKLGSRPQE